MKLRLVGGPVEGGKKCECEVDGSWAFGDLMFAFAEAAGASSMDGYNLHQTDIDGKKVKAGAVIKATDTPNGLGLKNNSIIMIKKGSGGSNPATPRDAAASPKPKAAKAKATAAPASHSSGAKSHRDRVVALYTKYDPGKLPTVDKMMKKFEGKEDDVIKTLVRKYGPEPPTDDDDSNAGASSSAASPEATPKTPGRTSATPSAAPSTPSGSGAKSHRDRVVAMYAKYAPEKLATVDKTMKRFEGQEDEVMKTLIKKYGPEPTDEAPAVSSRSATPAPQTPEAATPSEAASPSISNVASPRGGEMTYRERVVALYERYDPGKVGQTDALLKKHVGKEKNVISSLVKKYGPEPDPPTPVTPGGEPEVQRTSSTPPASVPHLNLVAAPKSYRDRLIALYEKYDPSKVGQVDKMLKKYEGQEDKVIAQLVKKLGPEPGTEEGSARSGAATPQAESGASGAASSRGSYKERVTAMYHKYDPAKAGQVDALLKKHEGKEKNVLTSLIKKYGPEPEQHFQATPAPTPAASPKKKTSLLPQSPTPEPAPPSSKSPAATETPPSAALTPREKSVHIDDTPREMEPQPATDEDDADTMDLEATARSRAESEVVMTPIETPREAGVDTPPPTDAKVAKVVPMEPLKEAARSTGTVSGKDRSKLIELAVSSVARNQFDIPLLRTYYRNWLCDTERQAIEAKMKFSVKAGEWEEAGDGKFRPAGSATSVEGVSLIEEFSRRHKSGSLDPALERTTRTLRQSMSTVDPSAFQAFPSAAYLQTAEVVQVLEESDVVVKSLSAQVKEARQVADQSQEETKLIQERRAQEVEELAIERKEMAQLQSAHNSLRSKIDNLELETAEAKAAQDLAEQRALKTKEKVKELKEELKCERTGVPTTLEKEMQAKDETIAKMHQQLAKYRLEVRAVQKQREEEREQQQKELRKVAINVKAKASHSRAGHSMSRFDAPTFASRQRTYGSQSPERHGNYANEEEYLPDSLDDTLDEERKMLIEEQGELEDNKKHASKQQGVKEEEDFNDDEVNLEPLPDRGHCPNCSTGLTSFNNDALEELMESEKAAFCFSCRQSFTAKDLRVRNQRAAKRDQLIAKHTPQY